MTPEQKIEAVEYRRLHQHPLHSPPHLQFHGQRQFFISRTCYEHQHHIGESHERMSKFEADLLTACDKFASSTYAWCVLPNHYHVLDARHTLVCRDPTEEVDHRDERQTEVCRTSVCLTSRLAEAEAILG